MIKNSKRKQKYIIWMSALIWLVIWDLAAHFTASVLLLPSPHDTVIALINMAGTSAFYLNLLFTILRCIIGIVSSFVIGAVAASLASHSAYAREFFKIPVSFFKSIPVMAIVIYVILIAKSDVVSIIVCFLMCFPISYSNILTGLDGMRMEYIELAKVNGLSTAQIYRLVLIPMLRPQISSALTLISGMSWKVVVASEVLSIPKYSIGYEMLKSKYYLETPQLFAYIFVLVLLSLLMEAVLGKILATVQNRKKHILHLGGKEGRSGNLEEIIIKNVSKSYEEAANAKDGTDTLKVKERTDTSSAFVSGSEKTGLKVLENYSENFDTGITAILGSSGRGKTTLARLISGLEESDSGEITHCMSISYLFQEDRLLPWMSVGANMMLGMINEKGLSYSEAEARVREAAEKLEIDSVLGKMPHELSGGMAHRAALGRAILRKSDVLILDEPFRGIDGELKGRLIDKLKEDIAYSDGKLRIVILITHEEDVAKALADRILRL